MTNDKDGTDGAGKSGDDATTVIAPAESEGEQTKTLSAEKSDETTVMTSVDGDTTTAMPATSGRVISSAQAGGRESNILPDNAGGSIQHAGRRASFDGLAAWQACADRHRDRQRAYRRGRERRTDPRVHGRTWNRYRGA